MVKRLNSDTYTIKNSSEENLESLGFRKHSDSYIYTFPVMYYSNRPTMECEIMVSVGDKEVTTNVYDMNHNIVPAFYYNGYGNFDVLVSSINQRILHKFKLLGIKKVKEMKKRANDNHISMRER